MYKNKKFVLLLLTIFSFLLNFSPIRTKEIKIYEGETFDRELQETIEKNKKLFLIFFARHCDYCGYTVRVLKERVVSHYENDDQISFGVINLNRQSNFWVGYQFNITQIPFIILIEGRKMYRYKDQFEEMRVVQFINEEKNVEDALDIPEDVGISKKINFFMAGLIRQISGFFIKFGFSNTMSNAFSCISLVLVVVVMVYLETKLLNGIRKLTNFFTNRKNNKENDNKDINNEKENKEEEEEMNDDQKNKAKSE